MEPYEIYKENKAETKRYDVENVFEHWKDAIYEVDAEKKYTIDNRKKIYRGFAKRCKKDIRRRLGWSLTEIGNF